MEDNGDHPQDAFELGRAAAAKLKEHNEELSQELPNALQTLFADAEFQEAMRHEVSGVVTDQRQTLTPVSSYSYNPSGAGGPSTRMLTRRGQQIQENQNQNYNSASRSPSISPPKAYLIEPKTTGPEGQESEDESESEEEEDYVKPSKSRRISHSWKGEEQEEVVEMTLTSTENNQEQESQTGGVPHFALLGTGTTTEGDGGGVENTGTGTIISSTQKQDGPEANCLCCNTSLEEKQTISLENTLMLRDLLWLSLGMKKFYDRTSSSFPFCDCCTTKISKLSDICTQVGQLEDEFNEIRGSLSEGIVSKHMLMTKAIDGVAPRQIGFLKSTVLRRMKKNFSTILPGKQLLRDVSRLKDSSGKDAEEENQSGASDEESEDETARKSTVVECRFCDKTFPTKRAMGIHEQKAHKLKGKLQCNICDKDFTTQKSLEIHTAKHANTEIEKHHKCNLCDKAFVSKSNLDDHARRHIGFRPFQCKICLEKYFVRRHINAHFLKRHPGKDPAKHVEKHAQPEIITGV